MGKSCSAFGCTNRFGKLRDDGTKLQFHSFPHKTPELLRQWVIATRRANWSPGKSAVLCGKHFSKDCYLSQKYLKKDAVPSIFNFPALLQKSQKKRRDIIKYQLISKRSEEEASHNASYVLSNLTDGTASNLTEGKPSSDPNHPDYIPSQFSFNANSRINEKLSIIEKNSSSHMHHGSSTSVESASKTTQLRIIGVSPHKLTCSAKSKKDSVNASKKKTQKREKFHYFRSILPKNAKGATLITDNDGMNEEIPPLTKEQLNVEYIEVKPDIFSNLASDGFSETTQSPLSEVLPDFRDKVMSEICASDEETNFSWENESAEVLKLMLKKLWTINKDLGKCLKESQMLCKLYAKENASLKEVIDNLRQIMAVSNDN